MSATPNFTGWAAVVLHRADDTTERLCRQLRLLGLSAVVQWEPLSPAARCDLVLVDADRGWAGLLPWQTAEAPVPVVALLGSEAPGRIAWAIDHGAGAILPKPLAASAVYPALVMAAHRHAERQKTRETIAELETRLKLRPLVFGAVQTLMRVHRLDQDSAFGLLRSMAMRQRTTLEQAAAEIAAGHITLPPEPR